MSNISKVNIINEIKKNKFTFENLFKGDYFISCYDSESVFMKTQDPFGNNNYGQYVDLKSGTINNIDPFG